MLSPNLLKSWIPYTVGERVGDTTFPTFDAESKSAKILNSLYDMGRGRLLLVLTSCESLGWNTKKWQEILLLCFSECITDSLLAETNKSPLLGCCGKVLVSDQRCISQMSNSWETIVNPAKSHFFVFYTITTTKRHSTKFGLFSGSFCVKENRSLSRTRLS